jgi:hypothetical protein
MCRNYVQSDIQHDTTRALNIVTLLRKQRVDYRALSLLCHALQRTFMADLVARICTRDIQTGLLYRWLSQTSQYFIIKVDSQSLSWIHWTQKNDRCCNQLVNINRQRDLQSLPCSASDLITKPLILRTFVALFGPAQAHYIFRITEDRKTQDCL